MTKNTFCISKKMLVIFLGTIIITLLIFGCSKSNPFLGKWVANPEQTEQGNKETFEKNPMMKLVLIPLMSMSIEVTDDNAVIRMMNKKKEIKYTINNNKLILENGNSIEFSSDKKYIIVDMSKNKNGEKENLPLKVFLSREK